MTLNDYIQNPMGKGNTVLSAVTRETQRNNYLAKFNQVMVRENGRIEYHCYYDEKRNVYWFHCKSPSEHVKNFYYDVVFKFFADAEKGTSNNLFDWNIQFYSNDPAFVYTYAYAFSKRNIFIPELTRKMSKEALTKESKEKNPDEQIGYCKIIFFAYLVMQNRNLNKLNLFKANLSVFSPKAIMDSIEEADSKVQDRQSRKVSYAKKKTISEDEYRKIKRATGANFSANVRTTQKVGYVKNTATIPKTKYTTKTGRKK